MYIPPLFLEDREERLEELMRRHPLAALVTLGHEGLIASHLPLVYEKLPDSAGVLHGHVSRANPQWQDFRPVTEALAIFQGPDAYVSPSWYASKQQTGRVVPTWDYAVVHAYGSMETYTEPARLRRHVESLVAIHEACFPQPWTLNDAPDEYVDGMLKAIVGIDIRITRLEGKWKVSQNRPAEDRAGVVEALANQGGACSAAIARLVEEYGGR